MSDIGQADDGKTIEISLRDRVDNTEFAEIASRVK
jgi:hypothetical protein